MSKGFLAGVEITDSFPVTADMRLQPNIGSDRSWVWKVAADWSDESPTSETLAIRFANSESKQPVVLHFCWF